MADAAAETAGWTRFSYSSADGLALAGRKYGWDNEAARGRLPALCLAGLSRNSADFHELALRLAGDPKTPRRVLCLDYRGRGMSARDPNRSNYNPITEAEDALAGAAAAGLEHAAVIGTSRGGLIAMILSALRPTLPKAAVLNDIGPEIGVRGLLRIKSYIRGSRDHANWSSAVAALREAGSQQFPAFGDADWGRAARQIFEERDGGIMRRFDPALAKTLNEVRIDQPLPALWPQFAGLGKSPMLVIRGDRSDILEPATLRKMCDQRASTEVIEVEGQGHAPDLATAGLPEQIAAFLAKAG